MPTYDNNDYYRLSFTSKKKKKNEKRYLNGKKRKKNKREADSQVYNPITSEWFVCAATYDYSERYDVAALCCNCLKSNNYSIEKGTLIRENDCYYCGCNSLIPEPKKKKRFLGIW